MGCGTARNSGLRRDESCTAHWQVRDAVEAEALSTGLAWKGEERECALHDCQTGSQALGFVGVTCAWEWKRSQPVHPQAEQ